ncbi:MAG TPA: hypothetical protein DIC42_06755 [Holosporales bacterium]|nr:hypothetical protein [Holosporales bacterium]
MQSQQEFTGLRAHFWPIKISDMKKFIPLFIIFMCLMTASTFIRDFTNIMIVNYHMENLSVVKFSSSFFLLGIIPLYLVGIHYFSPKKFFHTVLNVYIIGLAITYILSAFMPELLKNKPSSILVLLDSFRLITTVLCWTLVTQIFSIPDCKRVFPIFFVFISFALIPITLLDVSFSFSNNKGIYLLLSIGLCLIAQYGYYYLYKNILSFDEKEGQDTPAETHISFTDSLKQALTSPTLYLLLLLMVLLYTSKHMFDSLIKDYLKTFLAISGDATYVSSKYNVFMGNILQMKGLIEVSFLVLAGVGLLYKKSWGFVARLIPIAIVTASIIMLMLIALPDVSKYLGVIFHKTQAEIYLYGSVFCTILISMFSSMFFILKGMVYFYLSKSEQTKGRIIFEFIGTVILGKMLSPYIATTLMMAQNTKNMADIAPFLLGIIFVCGLIMFWVVRLMSKRMQAVEHA